MKKFFTLLILASIFVNVCAQSDNWGLIGTNLVYFPYDVSRYSPLDTSSLVVRYEASYPDFDIRKGDTRVSDITELQIGKHVNKFHSYNYDGMERKKAFGEQNAIRIRQNYIPYIIYTYHGKGEISVSNRIPFSSGTEAYTYTENMPELEWQITADTDTIAGYSCQHAVADFRGRTWDAWFTTEIPLRYGPWKLNGLPGLILKASERDGHYSFSVTEILTEPAAIVLPEWEYVKTSKKKWDKMERAMHENPYIYLSKGGKVKIFNGFTKEDMDASWTIPYYPMENE